MSHRVLLTDDAARDLEEIHTFVSSEGSPVEAERLLDRIEQTLGDLAELPERGRHPPELLNLGIKEYRETRTGPYRIIYRTTTEAVFVYLVVDGRRDMQALLARRLLW